MSGSARGCSQEPRLVEQRDAASLIIWDGSWYMLGRRLKTMEFKLDDMIIDDGNDGGGGRTTRMTRNEACNNNYEWQRCTIVVLLVRRISHQAGPGDKRSTGTPPVE
jgi:hypothetical protein